MNFWDAVIITLIAAAFAGAVIKMIRNKRKGGSSCGCGCDGCSMNCRNKDKK
jgi:hypothetical protein